MEKDARLYRVRTIGELHAIAGIQAPKHPHISIIDYSRLNYDGAPESGRFVCEFYSINIKSHCSFLYGREPFDHKEGTLLCTAPEQVIAMSKPEADNEVAGWGLFFHPELLRRTSLGKRIDEYSFFRYEENEALHLSAEEESLLIGLFKQIEGEYQSHFDVHSPAILINQLELLLNYCKRFYGRQFTTRSNHSQNLIAKFEQILRDCFRPENLKKEGFPTVTNCAKAMNLSANYLSDMLKKETGKTTQEHIHACLIDQCKTLLLSTNLSVNEVAFQFGFEYPQNLTKLFKQKMGQTPSEYRKNQASN